MAQKHTEQRKGGLETRAASLTPLLTAAHL